MLIEKWKKGMFVHGPADYYSVIFLIIFREQAVILCCVVSKTVFFYFLQGSDNVFPLNWTRLKISGKHQFYYWDTTCYCELKSNRAKTSSSKNYRRRNFSTVSSLPQTQCNLFQSSYLCISRFNQLGSLEFAFCIFMHSSSCSSSK